MLLEEARPVAADAEPHAVPKRRQACVADQQVEPHPGNRQDHHPGRRHQARAHSAQLQPDLQRDVVGDAAEERHRRVRVRVGPFTSRDEADKVARKIKQLSLQPQVLTL